MDDVRLRDERVNDLGYTESVGTVVYLIYTYESLIIIAEREDETNEYPFFLFLSKRKNQF